MRSLVHDIHQQTVVAKELLELCPPVTYTVNAELHTRDLPCPYPQCLGKLGNGWMMRRHFWDVHPLNLVIVPKEGRCGMQVNPLYPNHWHTKECQVRVEHGKQQETAISSVLALCQQFMVCGDVLEHVEVLNYLRRMMEQETMIFKPFGGNCGKPMLLGHAWVKSFGARTPRCSQLRGSIRLSFKPSSSRCRRRRQRQQQRRQRQQPQKLLWRWWRQWRWQCWRQWLR